MAPFEQDYKYVYPLIMTVYPLANSPDYLDEKVLLHESNDRQLTPNPHFYPNLKPKILSLHSEQDGYMKWALSGVNAEGRGIVGKETHLSILYSRSLICPQMYVE